MGSCGNARKFSWKIFYVPSSCTIKWHWKVPDEELGNVNLIWCVIGVFKNPLLIAAHDIHKEQNISLQNWGYCTPEVGRRGRAGQEPCDKCVQDVLEYGISLKGCSIHVQHGWRYTQSSLKHRACVAQGRPSPLGSGSLQLLPFRPRWLTRQECQHSTSGCKERKQPSWAASHCQPLPRSWRRCLGRAWGKHKRAVNLSHRNSIQWLMDITCLRWHPWV